VKSKYLRMLGFSRVSLKSATCQSHMNRKNFYIETWKKVSNLYNIENQQDLQSLTTFCSDHTHFFLSIGLLLFYLIRLEAFVYDVSLATWKLLSLTIQSFQNQVDNFFNLLYISSLLRHFNYSLVFWGDGGRINVLPLLSLHSYSGFYNVDMQYKFHIYEIIVLYCTF